MIQTVTGPIDPADTGVTLAHEHVLVDFAGAADFKPRWEHDKVIAKVLPHLQAIHLRGCRMLVECTPDYLGRDVRLLKKLSEAAGIRILTNTGYYGGSDHKFLPAQVHTESPEQLAARWTAEWENGIEGTGIHPGFIKTSVNNGPLSEVSRKLIHAAGLTHLQTGLTIASHTGKAVPAMEQIALLESIGVAPSAFIWVHAHHEKEPEAYLDAATQGAWISIDGLREGNVDEFVHRLVGMKRAGFLNRVLLSHDAGWYRPDQPDGGEFRPFTTLFDKLLPALRQAGLTQADLDQLLIANPAQAFTIRVRKQ